MRLIDVDDFFPRMENDTDLCAEMETDGLKALKKYLDMQPTAYDIDKVVEELEEEAERWEDSGKEYKDKCEIAVCRGLRNSIEIVKQGCSSDDCCEWESDYGFVSDKYKRETSCGYTFYDLHHATPFKYCPYCGKKIKVVE